LLAEQVTQEANGNPTMGNGFSRLFVQPLEHFVTFALIPERGPDFQSRAIVGSELRLPLLASILREAEERPINDLIQRGWHIIALEYKGELSMTEELMNRRAIFVMGHPEMPAAILTLNSKYYSSNDTMKR
jgi:hypothetical protein